MELLTRIMAELEGADFRNHKVAGLRHVAN